MQKQMVFTLPVFIVAMSVAVVDYILDSNDLASVSMPTASATAIDMTSSNAQVVQAAEKIKPSSNVGTVIDSRNAGGYTYIEIDVNGQSFWMAANMTVVNKGDKVRWNDYAMQYNFSSKKLQRTFDQIMFVDRLQVLPAQDDVKHQGVVVTTTNAAGYSYIEVEENGSKLWLAAPLTQLVAGQVIEWQSGLPMKNFSSKSLQRTFNEIFFVGEVHDVKS